MPTFFAHSNLVTNRNFRRENHATFGLPVAEFWSISNLTCWALRTKLTRPGDKRPAAEAMISGKEIKKDIVKQNAKNNPPTCTALKNLACLHLDNFLVNGYCCCTNVDNKS